MYRSAYLVLLVTMAMMMERSIWGKILDKVRHNYSYYNTSVVAHRSYNDESLMVVSFNLDSLVHADEQSSYQLGIAVFWQAYYFFLSGDEVQWFRIDIHLAWSFNTTMEFIYHLWYWVWFTWPPYADKRKKFITMNLWNISGGSHSRTWVIFLIKSTLGL